MSAKFRFDSLPPGFREPPPQKHKLSQRGHELQPELGSFLLEQVDLLVAVSLVVVLHPFVNVLLTVLQHAIDESGEPVGHGGDGLGGP